MQYLAQQTLVISQKQAGSDAVLRTSVVFEAMGVPDFVDDDKMHLYSALCQQSVVYLASQRLFREDHTFLVEWSNWLLRVDDASDANGASTEPTPQVEDLSGIVNVDLLNDVLTLKSMMMRDARHRSHRQSSMTEIINELCDAKGFDLRGFEMDKL